MGHKRQNPDDNGALDLFFRAQGELQAGREEAAERLHRQALAAFEKGGQTHGLHAFLARGQVANILANRQDYAQSLLMFRKALDLYPGTKDSNDRACISIVRSMAIVLEDSGDLPAALQAFREVVDRSTRVNGEDHPNTLRSVKELAQTLARTGHGDEAEHLHWVALKGHKAAGSLGGTDALVSKNELALALLEDKDFRTAERLLREVIRGREQQLGPDDPRTLLAKQNLAAALTGKGDINAAVALFDDVLEAKARVLGPDHPDTVLTRDNVISLLLAQRDYLCCEPHLREQVRAIRKTLPRGHEHTVELMINHGECLLALKREEEAGPVLADAVRHARVNLGDDHPLTQKASKLLADMV